MDVKVGDRVKFRNLLGLEEELLVEAVFPEGVEGRGIFVAKQQVIEVLEHGSTR